MKKAWKAILLGVLSLSFLVVLSACDASSEDQAETVLEPGMQRFGEKGYGYVSVPESWIEYKDFEPVEGEIKYSDGFDAIITLNILKKCTDPTAALSELANKMEADGATDIDSATDTINGKTAYQVYGYYEDTLKYKVAWMFEASDGRTHYICVEGSGETIMDSVNMVKDSYSAKK